MPRTAALLVLLASRWLAGATGPPPRHVDALGDPLPPRAVARLGTHRLYCRHLGGMALAPRAAAVAALDPVLGEVCVWELPSGRPRWRAALPVKVGYGGGCALHANDRLAFSRDGRKFAASYQGAALGVWDAATGRRLHTLKKKMSGPGPLAFSPDGRQLAASDLDDVGVWDVATGRRVAGWPIAQYAGALAWSADGRLVVVREHPDEPKGGRDRERFSWWEAATGKPRGAWRPPKEVGWRDTVISPDGERVAGLASDWLEASVRGLPDGREVLRAPSRGPLRRPVFSAGGHFVATVEGKSGSLRVWEAATGKLVRSVTPGVPDVVSLLLAEDGKTAVLASGLDDALHVWDLGKNRPLHRPYGHRAGPLLVAFSRDGKEVATTTYDSTVRDAGHRAWSLRRWDAATGKERLRVEKGPGGVDHAVFSADARHLGLVLRDHTLRLYDAERGREVRRWPLPTDAEITEKDGKRKKAPPLLAVSSFAFSADGRELLAGGEKLFRWEVASGKKLPAFAVPSAQGFALPDSLLSNRDWAPISTWAPSRLQLIDAKTGQAGARFPAPPAGGADLALSADGRTLAALHGGRVRLWEVASGLPRGEAPGVAERWGHLSLSADGRLLAVMARNERVVRLWDLGTGKARATLEGHKDTIVSLAFSPDGRRLATGAADNVAYVWDTTGPAAERLSAGRLEELWGDLHSPDGGRAYRAVWALADDPARAVPCLRKRLLSPGEEGPRIARLIEQLDDDAFRARQAASAGLARLGARAGPALARALRKGPSFEARRRLQDLLKKLPPGEVPSPRTVGQRAIEALEKAGTPKARAALEELAKRAVWKAEATAALRRLRR